MSVYVCRRGSLLDWTIVLLVFIAGCLVGSRKICSASTKKGEKKWPTLELGGSII